MEHTQRKRLVWLLLGAALLGACRRSRPNALRVDGSVTAVTSLPYAEDLAAADDVVEVAGREYEISQARLWRAINFFLGRSRLRVFLDVEATDGLPIDPQLVPVEIVVVSESTAWVVTPELAASPFGGWTLSATNGPEGAEWQHRSRVDIGLVLMHPTAGFVYLLLPDVTISEVS